MFKLENLAEWIRKFDFYDNIVYVRMFKFDNITKRNEQLDFFDNVVFV